ncbi:uncharacterized protein BP5553_02226 [Venustampulla echinocandica]|uniref:Histone-lysine N-methyltransferase, H3 lysine-9 specific dim-5 n=1 Tax=Venustampulla echinocandica TaxID=2656787 RepID=A0A370U399_9HELO|nr:uncharacterized protein BP5553_02226 [Venustampulla echinocandica]RDL42247.1 hypothetical protein BP5553_02226 [Venustampulla echinocandica]
MGKVTRQVQEASSKSAAAKGSSSKSVTVPPPLAVPHINIEMRERFHRHFYFHGKDNQPELEAERKACHWCQIISFTTAKLAPISIVNPVDDECLPKDFVFIQHCVPGEGIYLPDAEFLSGCDCKKTSSCKYAKCHCLQDMTILDKRRPEVYVYKSVNGGEYLREEYLDTREPIYECNSKCSCDDGCPNRVVEKGRTVPLQVFRTSDNRGWGVRCLRDVKKGQFIDRYVGELITTEETEMRRQQSVISQKKDVYLFELDKFKGDSDRDPSLANTVFVDGEFKSGPSRFINHSCDPNLRIFARVSDHALKRFHDLAFFAIKDIPANTELTFDYVDGEDEKLEEEKKDPGHRKEMTRCLCKAKNCRGYLW